MTAAGRLTGQAHAPVALERAADLVREMNCYYSSLIEGYKATPREIKRALQCDFADDKRQRDSRELSLAHIAVVRLMEGRLAAEPVDVYAPEFVRCLHREFYSHLPDRLHWAKTTGGRAISMAGVLLRRGLGPDSASSCSKPCSGG